MPLHALEGPRTQMSGNQKSQLQVAFLRQSTWASSMTKMLSITRGLISLELAALAHLNACCASSVHGFFCHLKHILCNFYKHQIKKDHVPIYPYEVLKVPQQHAGGSWCSSYEALWSLIAANSSSAISQSSGMSHW